MDVEERERSLREQFLRISQDKDLSPNEKAKKQQALFRGPKREKKTEHLSLEEALAKVSVSYQDGQKEILGCSHYPRGAQIRAPCCGKFYPCRVCHDEEETTHVIDRYSIEEMLCMYCFEVQKFGQFCVNKDCPSQTRNNPSQLARYCCMICKFLDDTPDKAIYHCKDCRLCRIGEGLGEKLFHCDKCWIDLPMQLKGNHVCIERSSENECPVCSEVLFASRKTLMLMNCGHPIHQHCCDELLAQNIYACPICSKTFLNQEDARGYWDLLRFEIQRQKMPEEFGRSFVQILCNDCNKESDNVPFHFLGHECEFCHSFNTQVTKNFVRQ